MSEPVRNLGRAGRPVVRLRELRALALQAEAREPLELRADGLRPPDRATLLAVGRVNSNHLGFVDALVAAEGFRFAGTWFSTFTQWVKGRRP